MRQLSIILQWIDRIAFLPIFSLCFCSGICLIKYTHIPFLFLYLFAWILLIISFIFIRHKVSIWLLLTLAVLLGGLFLSNTYILHFPHIRNFTFYKSEAVTVRGVVSSFPQIKPNFSSFVFNAQELTWAGKIYPVCGKVLVRIFRKENVSYADQLILAGRLFRPYQPKHTRFPYRDYLENQDIYSILTVSKNRAIKYLGKGEINPFKFSAYKIRKKSQDILFDNLKPTQAGIFSAMILGERSKIALGLRRLFLQTGTMHILAISGLHVGIVAFILDLLLKVLRIRRHPRFLAIIILLIFYCFLTGARPSVIRAAIMAIVLLVGFLLHREIKASHSLALAGLIILAVNPRQLFNPGFQLSFASVISIVYLSPVIKRLFNTAKVQGYAAILQFASQCFCVSLAAWLGVLPFIIYYFKIVSPVTILANLVVVPYLSLVIALGFSLLFIGIIFPVLAPIFASPANLSIVILIQIIRLFNQIPWAYFYL